MFLVSKALPISIATVIVRAGGAIWLNPSTTVLFNVCSVFIGFWDGEYVSHLLYLWYYVGVKSSFQHAREECESKRAYVF